MKAEQRDKSVLDAALGYLGRGLSPIDLPPDRKSPDREEWQNQRLTEDDLRALLDRDRNIGVLLGEPSGGLVDVDLDSKTVLPLAEKFLPETGAVFGREGKPGSHRLYRVEGAEPREFAYKTPEGKKRMLLEIRSTGQQTIFPPSVHPSGEPIGWEKDGEPGRLEGAEDLERACAALATAGLIAEYLPDRGEGRHYFVLPVAGFLLKPGRLSEELVTKLLKAAGHQTPESRRGRERLPGRLFKERVSQRS